MVSVVRKVNIFRVDCKFLKLCAEILSSTLNLLIWKSDQFCTIIIIIIIIIIINIINIINIIIRMSKVFVIRLNRR